MESQEEMILENSEDGCDNQESQEDTVKEHKFYLKHKHNAALES